MTVMLAPVSTKNQTGVPSTIPLTYRPSSSPPAASVLTEGKVGLSVKGSVGPGLQPLNSTVLFPLEMFLLDDLEDGGPDFGPLF